MAVLTWLGVPSGAGTWSQLGFALVRDTIRVGAVQVSVGRGRLEWGFDVHAARDLGVPTKTVAPPDGAPADHANGVTRVDHVVYRHPDLDAAALSLAELGLDLRRRGRPRAGGPEMAFFRAGEVVVEVVGMGDRPDLWGIALRSADLDATVSAIKVAGGAIGDVKPAVQGGRIATIRAAGFPLAVLEPASG